MGRRWTKTRLVWKRIPLDLNTKKLEAELKKVPTAYDGRCAYCGRLLRKGQYHFMYDEFGQRVRKCNNERMCSQKRTGQNELSYRKAMRLYGVLHGAGYYREYEGEKDD